MQELKTGNLPGKARLPLAAKGSLPRAFLSLGVCVEIGLLFFGSYLLTQALMQPLQASAAAVVSGGLFLSLASVLLFYLVWPAKAKSAMFAGDNLEEEEGDVITVNAKAIPEQPDTDWLAEKSGNSCVEWKQPGFTPPAKPGRNVRPGCAGGAERAPG